jgi:mono/diheme cytochrome c family protein
VTRAFAWIGVILLVVTFWGLWTDHSREWKGYQKQFKQLVFKKTQADLIEAKDRLKGPEWEAAEQELKETRARTKSREGKKEYAKAKKDFKKARFTFFKADRERQFIKSELDAAFYKYEHAVKAGHPAEKYQEDLDRLKADLGEQEEKASGLERVKDQAADRIARYEDPIKAAESKLDSLEGDIKRLERRLSESRPGPFSNLTGLEIKQVNLEGLHRVDRCMSCHLGIDKAGFEDAPQPFTTHPNREFIFAKHPVDQVGCTVCHGGQGRATTAKAAHGDVLHWHQPLKKGIQVETSCFACHSQVTELAGAPVVMRGRQLFEQYGCWACHQVEGFKPLMDRKVGPDLVRVGSKTHEAWLARWIENPSEIRPKTRMPRFQFEEGEVKAISAYLISLTDEKIDAPYQKAKAQYGHKAGFVLEGQQLFQQLNCLGCHTLGGEGDAFAPDLSFVGDKDRPEWLYQWVKNPKALQPDTLMPDLRLTDREAYVLTEYLSTLKEGKGSPGRFTNGNPHPELVAKGKEIISDKGCLACHDVAGIEQQLVIPPLTGLGDKSVHELEFGYTDEEKIPRTVLDWVHQKIRDPHIFDTDRIVANMPKFNLDEGQIESLVTYLMTLTEHLPPDHYHDQMTQRDRQIELGRKVVRERNCVACHKVEGKGSDIAPDLRGEGKKVRQQWLFDFLKKPHTLRPWLEARMPTFGFADWEATALVAYFAALDEEPYPFEGFETVRPTHEERVSGKQLFEMFRCLSCHVAGEVPQGQSTENLAPNLVEAKHRLKPEWMISWITDPQNIQPGTRMPTNWPNIQGKFYVPPPAKEILDGDVHRQIKAVRDYLLTFEEETERQSVQGSQ